MATDADCALCHQLYYKPVRTLCGHSFCEFCLLRWLAARRPPGRLDWSSGHSPPTCPMCRAPISRTQLQLDQELERRVKEQDPEEYLLREQQVLSEQEDFHARQQSVKKLIMGNTHDLMEQSRGGRLNVHRWEFFVAMEDEEDEQLYIDHVCVRLHPTFSPHTVTIWEPPFRVRRVGWGVFYILATVFFKQEWCHPPVRVAWLLDFDGAGSYQEAELSFQPSGGASEAPAPPAPPSPSHHAAAAQAAPSAEQPTPTAGWAVSGGNADGSHSSSYTASDPDPDSSDAATSGGEPGGEEGSGVAVGAAVAGVAGWSHSPGRSAATGPSAAVHSSANYAGEGADSPDTLGER